MGEGGEEAVDAAGCGGTDVGRGKDTAGSGCFRGRPRGLLVAFGGSKDAIGGEGTRSGGSSVTGAVEFGVAAGVVGEVGEVGGREVGEGGSGLGRVIAPERV